jgi:acyl carrier protein phosphodiesterase
MNFLAHLYLSGNNEEIIVGNFIGDYVKGSDYMNYPENIKKGLLLHRHIDSFTDCHPVTRKSKQHVEAHYRKYSGIVIDIFYDFLLASEWERYSNISLEDFVENTFSLLKKYYDVFPQGIKNWFPNFIRNNWLMSYSYERGVEMVLHRMASRTSLPEFTDFAMEVLDKQRDSLFEEFNEFFPSIRRYIQQDFEIETGRFDNEVNKGMAFRKNSGNQL